MVGDPPFCEAVELVELRLGVVFRVVAHVDPVEQELLDLVAGKVRVLFLDTLNGLLEIDRLCVWPDQCSLLGVELHVLQQVPEDIAYRYALLALGRVSSNREFIEERVIREDTVLRMLLALLAHELPSIRSDMSHRGPFRVGAAAPCFEISIVPARGRNTRRPRFPQRSSSRLVRIMSPSMVNEL